MKYIVVDTDGFSIADWNEDCNYNWFKKMVGGYLQSINYFPNQKNIVCVVNEEGKLKNLPLTCYTAAGQVLRGTVIICGIRSKSTNCDDGEDEGGEEFCGLTEEQANRVYKTLIEFYHA